MVRTSRRGNYSILMSAAIFMIFAFGMMAVDITLMRLAQQQTQDVADAASQAALLMYRVNVTDDGAAIAKQKAEGIAGLVVQKNGIIGEAAQNFDVDWGSWDAVERVWDSAQDASPNAVQVTVQRDESQPVSFVLAPIFGRDTFTTSRPSTSAIRTLEAMLSVDITGSWDKDDFYKAREAAVAFLNELHGNHGPDDVIGMTLFHSRYGWEYTRFTEIAKSAADPTLIQRPWETDLNVGNYAGDYVPAWQSDTSKAVACRIYGNRNWDGTKQPWEQVGGHSLWGETPGWQNTVGCDPHGPIQPASCYNGNRTPGGGVSNNYTHNWAPGLPANASISRRGNCHPNMPRYYRDEDGTDHSVGLYTSKLLFDERNNPMAYRALIVLTDGKPAGYNGQSTNLASAGKFRKQQNFKEYESTLSLPYDGSNRRMRQYKYGPGNGLQTVGSPDATGPGHTANQIRSYTKTVAQDMYANDNINIWFVSFVEEEDFMKESAKGDGYFAKANSADEIKPIFVQIARSLPAAIVE